MRKVLLKIAYWIIDKYNIPIITIPDSIMNISPLVKIQVECTRQMNGLLSNEYRHAHTYATLRKKLPNEASRDIGLCIELVVYGLL